jgi:hypothetical protein
LWLILQLLSYVDSADRDLLWTDGRRAGRLRAIALTSNRAVATPLSIAVVRSKVNVQAPAAGSPI